MTVLGLNSPEKSEDKETLVKDDVVTVLPTRARLVKARKTRLVTKLILSFSILFVLLIGTFLTVCYLRQMGPFQRKINGFCPVGQARFNRHRKVFNSFEITDQYVLINVPRFNYRNDRLYSVRTLHVFKPKLTIFQYRGLCFVKPWNHAAAFAGHNWYNRLRNMEKHHQTVRNAPTKFSYRHFRLERPALPVNYLRDQVHSMAHALCHDRPVYRLRLVMRKLLPPVLVHREGPGSCVRPCPALCPRDRPRKLRFYRRLPGLGKRCLECHCSLGAGGPMPPVAVTTPSPGCMRIHCVNNCTDGSNGPNCKHCVCIDPLHQNANKRKLLFDTQPTELHLPPIIVESKELDGAPATPLPTFKDYSQHKPIYAHGEGGLQLPKHPLPVEQDKNKFKPVNNLGFGAGAGGIHRNKRSAVRGNCAVIAQFFEGYTPLDVAYSNVDYIHDNC